MHRDALRVPPDVFRAFMLSPWILLLCTLAHVGVARAAAPTISGSPPTTAVVGQPYSFTPQASDADGDRLIFSIVNRPGWASFNRFTGELHGTPSSDDQGSFADIRIGVSDGWRWWRRETVYLPAFSVTVTAADDTPEPEPANEPPVISGNPPTEVVQGSTYDFTPEATDPDGDVLSFSVGNKPSWAAFNTSSGRLSGTPGSADLGDYPDISITADDGADTASLAPFSIAVVGNATGTATLSWQAPTARTDGSPLDNLAGYRILWGTSEGSYPNSVEIDNPGITSYVIENLAPAVYYFVVVAIDANELESEHSNEAQKTIGSM